MQTDRRREAGVKRLGGGAQERAVRSEEEHAERRAQADDLRHAYL